MQYAHVAALRLPCVLAGGGDRQLLGSQEHLTPRHCGGRPCAVVTHTAYRTDGTERCSILTGSMVIEPCNALFHVLAISGFKCLHEYLG